MLCNYFIYKQCCAAIVSMFSPKHFTHLSFLRKFNAKIKWGTKRCQTTKTSSYLFFPAASASPCCIKVWLFISLFMCAVKHHHESWLFSNNHYIQKRTVALLQTFLFNNSLHTFNFLSSRLLPFTRSNTSLTEMHHGIMSVASVITDQKCFWLFGWIWDELCQLTVNSTPDRKQNKTDWMSLQHKLLYRLCKLRASIFTPSTSSFNY